MAHLGSIRTVCNQSPQMKHARNASRRLTANFDVGSFQWKKDAKLMNDHIPGVWYFFTPRLRICFGQFDMGRASPYLVYQYLKVSHCRTLSTLDHHI